MNKINLALQRWMGKIALLQNDPERAAHYFELALSLEQNNIKIINDLQVACKNIPNWERFFELYHEALTKWPAKAYIRANIGISYMHLSRYEEALPYIENYVRSQVNSGSNFSPNMYSKLGICYAYLGHWDLAETALAKAEEEYPWDVDMIFGKMCILYGTSRTEDILGYLETKINRYPRMYPLLYWKADFTRNILRQPEESIEWYQSALSVVNLFSYKRKYEPYYFVVNAYCSLATVVEEYLSVLSETGKLRKDITFRTWWWLGTGFVNKVALISKKIQNGDYKLAKDECLRLLGKRIPPDMRSVTLSYLALAQSGLGELDQALANGIEAVSLNPEKFFSRDTLGSIYLKIEQWKDAKEIYQQLTAAEPFISSYFEDLGIALKNLGDLENAKLAYEKVLQLDPHNSIALSELNSIRTHLDQNL